MKAIETRYKGYRFRSRLEARWAVFFDALGLEWDYELEGFELPSGRYLPDFFLPEMSLWVEIKGAEPTPRELQKTRSLAVHGCVAAVLWWGTPRVDWPKDSGVLFAWDEKGFTEALACGTFMDCAKGLSLDAKGSDLFTTPSYEKVLLTPSADNCFNEQAFTRTKAAIGRARSARFEFGEVPA